MKPKEGYKQTDIGVIPEDWQVGKIADYNPFITSGSRGWARFYSDTGAPFLRITNMSRNAVQIDLSDLKLVNLPDRENEGKRTQLQTGDILISITADVGIISYVDVTVPKPAYISQHVALVRFNNNDINSLFLSYFLTSINAQKNFASTTDGGAKAGMSLSGIGKINILKLPTFREQTAIATVLSDTDALISRVETLIEKKRDIKQGAMQQLLKPKEGWVVKRLRDYITISSGESPSKFSFGLTGIPYFKVEQLNNCNKYQIDTPYYIERGNLIPKSSLIFPKRGASILLNKIRILKEDSFMDTNLMTLTLLEGLNNEFVYYWLSFIELWRIADTTSIPQINNKHINSIEISVPTIEEQVRTAQILSDMDAEIAGLEQKLAKYKLVKQGMMQELLTGKTRLV